MIEEKLNQLALVRHAIRKRERDRDEKIQAYKKAIRQVELTCADETESLRADATALERELEEYAAANLPEDKKSIRFDNGILQFRRQAPRFFFGEDEVTGNNAQLLKFVKANAPEYLKVEESVDWANFKKKLCYSGEAVCYDETYEVIAGLRMEIPPDKFTVHTA